MLKNMFRKQRQDNICTDNLTMQFRGELEIIAEKDGKIIHRDKHHNIVTNWARHANMKLIGSASWSKIGDGNVTVLQSDETVSQTSKCFSQRSVDPSNHVADTVNIDGTLISEQQYFSDNTDYHDETDYFHYNKSKMIDDEVNYKFPYFPTKMLFGTGKEYKNWADIPAEFKGNGTAIDYETVENGSWGQVKFDANIEPSFDIGGDIFYNYYSATDKGKDKLIMCKTMNDLYSSSIPESEFTVNRIGIKGAIKNSFFYEKSSMEGKTEQDSEGFYFPINEWKGVGLPCFIYCRRNDTEINFEQDDSGNLVTKLSFTTIMPAQEGLSGEDTYYPYNGYLLKEAGLFCDARFSNTESYQTVSGSGGEEVPSTGDSLTNYNKMPGGLMWATRPIAPVFKDHRTSITARWTIYIQSQ